jgi:hypothetical protein
VAIHNTPTALSNPSASLLGRPTELRMEIYLYLVEPARFYIGEQHQDANLRKWELKGLRPCLTPDSMHPSLCAKPCFSGLSPPEALCHNISMIRLNRFAIRQVFRLFYKEFRGILSEDWIILTLVQHTDRATSVLGSATALQMEMSVDLTI